MAAAGRNHDLGQRELRSAARAWEGYWAATRPVELIAAVERHAGGLTALHALRGADAVHLASALAIEDSDLVVAVWDGRLTQQRGQQVYALRRRTSTVGPAPALRLPAR
jgi:predicted nucleic acid-binding protein